MDVGGVSIDLFVQLMLEGQFFSKVITLYSHNPPSLFFVTIIHRKLYFVNT